MYKLFDLLTYRSLLFRSYLLFENVLMVLHFYLLLLFCFYLRG